MSEFVPSGYLSIREALNRLGRELFPLEWTGGEDKARRNLMSEEDWLRIKDLPPAHGGGAGIEPGFQRPKDTGPSDPSDPAYQEEYRARKRYTDVLDRLRQSLEAGHLEAAILDPWSGQLHEAPASLWRRHDADRMIEKGRAPIPRSPNTGSILVKRFGDPNVDTKPLPQAKIKQAIEALKAKLATESLTRSEQEDFLRETFPGFRIATRQFRKIFQAIPAPKGRPRKSDA